MCSNPKYEISSIIDFWVELEVWVKSCRSYIHAENLQYSLIGYSIRWEYSRLMDYGNRITKLQVMEYLHINQQSSSSSHITSWHLSPFDRRLIQENTSQFCRECPTQVQTSDIILDFGLNSTMDIYL
jgi:hypothetical protein